MIQVRNSHGVLKCAEVTDLSTKYKVTQLSIGKEDDEEHHSKATHIFCALQKKYTNSYNRRRL